MAPNGSTFETIYIHVFEDILPSVLDNLDDKAIKYKVRTPVPGAIVASAVTVQIIGELIDGPVLAAIAAILVAYIENRRSRKLIITTRDNKIIHAEGSSVEEVERLLTAARDVVVFEPTSTARRVEQKHTGNGK